MNTANNNIEVLGNEDNEDNEIAIEISIQAKCALLAVCKILTTLPTSRDEGASHLSKKAIKHIRKQIQKDVYSQIDKISADELVKGNYAVLEGTAAGNRKSTAIPKGKHHLMLEDMSNNFRKSMLIGYNKFYGG